MQMQNRVVTYFITGVVAASSLLTYTSTASATSAQALYSYKLGDTLTSVPNLAAANASTALTLQGDVAFAIEGGILFDGDKTSKQSVGYANPAQGPTLSATADEAVSASVKLLYKGPKAGTCNPDSVNITQIGRAGAGLSQIKLQLSNCNTDTTSVFPECRVAGTISSKTVPILRGSQNLIDGESYVVSCIKETDTSTAGRIIMTTTRLMVDTSQTTTDYLSVPKVGDMQSSAYLSVANKYPLPKVANNTDQFYGVIQHVAYCKASDTLAVDACITDTIPTALSTEEPASAPDPQLVTSKEFVTNTGIEQSIDGWDNKRNKFSVLSRDVSQAYSGVASLKAASNSSSSAVIGFKDSPSYVNNAESAQTYTARVWVKSQSAGQSLTLRMREMSGSSEVSAANITQAISHVEWTELVVEIQPKQDGTSLSFVVFGTVPAYSSFWADDFSIVQ